MKVDNITLMMFVLNFVEFCIILELIYSSSNGGYGNIEIAAFAGIRPPVLNCTLLNQW